VIVVLDRGHGQKPDRFDPGVTLGKLREIDLATAYITHAAGLLTAAGHTVHLLHSGSYDARHREALRLVGSERGLYVQCHLNAGKGTYGLVMHDGRSSEGKHAAECFAATLGAMPEISRREVWPLTRDSRGWACIDGIWPAPRMCGLVFEPGFIDAPAHVELWTPAGLRRVGEALAAGVRAFAG